MQTLNAHSYIQYTNQNGTIKSLAVQRNVIENELHFVIPPIQEDFFILGLYDLNKRVLGVTFLNVTNLDNLGFLNSDFQDIEAIPEMAFIQANTDVTIVKDLNDYDKNLNVVVSAGNSVSVSNLPEIQAVRNVAPDYSYIFYRDFSKASINSANKVDFQLKQVVMPANSIVNGTRISFDLIQLKRLPITGTSSLRMYISDDLNNLKKYEFLRFLFGTDSSINFGHYGGYNFFNANGVQFLSGNTGMGYYASLNLTLPIYFTWLGNSDSAFTGEISIDAFSISRLG